MVNGQFSMVNGQWSMVNGTSHDEKYSLLSNRNYKVQLVWLSFIY